MLICAIFKGAPQPQEDFQACDQEVVLHSLIPTTIILKVVVYSGHQKGLYVYIPTSYLESWSLLFYFIFLKGITSFFASKERKRN